MQHTPTAPYLHSLLLAVAFLLAGATSAQQLVKLKSIRNHTAELRAHLAAAPGSPWSIQFRDSQGTPRFTLSTACSQQGNLPGQLCFRAQDTHAHLRLPQALTPDDDLIFRQRGNAFQLLTAQDILLHHPCPTSLKGSLWASADAQGHPCLRDLRYQRLEPIVFGDDFMRTEEEAKSFGLWHPVSGTWNIHSVMETIRANPAARIRAGKIPVPDRSPNPFTLAGSSSGEPALIVTGYPFWSDYEVAVTTKPHESTTGLVFAYQDPQNYWSVQWTLTSTGTTPSPLRLIQTRQGKDALKGSVSINGRSDNWYRLAATAQGDLITVSVDGVPVLTHRTLQCTGGKIGLLARGSGETFFDDVSVRSVQEYSPSLPDLQKGTSGALNAWALTSHPVQPELIAQTAQASLTYGSPNWPPQRLTAQLKLPPNGECSWSIGADKRLQITVNTTGANTRLTLTQGTQTLQAITLPVATDSTALTLDCTQLHTVRVFLDGNLALRHQDAQLPPLGGAVTLTANTPGLALRRITFFQTERRDWERPVDVKKFANDPFMQGWASNRYAWNRTKPRGTFPQPYVFSGDVYGAFSLETPIIHNLDYQFGHDDHTQQQVYALQTRVDTKRTSATVTLLKAGKTLATANLDNLTYKLSPGVQIIDEKIGKRPKTPDTPTWGTMTFHRDGYLLWLEHNGKTVLTANDPTPATGRTVTATIPQNLDFIHINLIRDHVRDYLFEKAEADWSTLGRWEVTNRFACDPRWSHMNGESFGIAALLSRFQLQGDFTLECFAGMRMRQGPLKGNSKLNYPRVGDINVALQTLGGDLFSGYNLLIQKWDPKWSESVTDFMRLNRTIQHYQGELIPSGRVHSPSKRIIPVDYDPGGRAVHGAWYALKIRRTEKRYQAWFDNHQIMDVTDPAPLKPLGRIALWTQNNSIVLARVKVNYRKLVPVCPLAHPAPDSLPQQLLKDSPDYSSTLLPPLPQTPELPQFTPWNGDQSAGITLLKQDGKDTIALFRNLNGGGDFGACIRLPDKNQLLATHALEFDFRCSPQTKVNLYLAPQDGKLPRFFVPLTGPQHDEADLISLGKPNTTPKGDWTHVAIPLTRRIYQQCPWFKNQAAEYLMLGMLHEGYLNAGLNGNQKGQWFAITNLSLRTISKAEAEALPKEQQFHLLPPTDDWGLNPLEIRLAGLPVFSPRLLVNASLEIANRPFTSTIPDKKGRKTHFFYLNDTNVRFHDGRLTLTPRKLPFHAGTAYFKLIMEHPISGEPFATTWSQNINPGLDRTPPEPPCIDHAIALLASNSQGLKDLKASTLNSHEFFCRKTTSPAGVPAAHIIARASGTHMVTDFDLPRLDARDYPYLFMDLKLEDDTYASLLMRTSRGTAYLRLNESRFNKPGDLGILPGFKDSQTWQTLTVPILELMEKLPQRRPTELRRLTHLSIGDYGYSGSFPGAAFQVSNLRFARTAAAMPDNPLRISWQATDLGGIAKYAVRWSAKYDDEPDLNQTQTQPSLTAANLPEGLNVLHVKACDHNGNWSPTTHQPFIINNERPTITPLTPAPGAQATPQELTATLTDIKAHLNVDKVTLTCNGKTLLFRPYMLSEQFLKTNNRQLTLDLLPLIAQHRKPIPDKTPFTVTLTGLTTSLGTAVPACTWTWTTDYKLDKQPPYPPTVSANRTFRHYNTAQDHRAFQRPESNVTLVTDELTNSTCLQLKSDNAFIATLHRGKITPQAYPLFMFQCRVAPKTIASLFVKTTKGSHEIPLATLKVRDDNQWHDVNLNLRELADKTPKLKNATITAMSIGKPGKHKAVQQIRLDNVALVPALPPVPDIWLSAADATGINAFYGLLTRKPVSLDPALTKLKGNSWPDLMLTEKGLWYLNLACQDGAGNLSETIHVPVWCDAPILPDDKQAQSIRPWQLMPVKPKQKRVPRMSLRKLSSPTKTQARQILCLKLQKGKKPPAFLVERVNQAPSSSLTIDLLVSATAPLGLTLQPVLLDASRNILLRGKAVPLKPHPQWQRKLRFELPDTPLPPQAEPRYRGFLMTVGQRQPATLLFQNIRTQRDAP